MKKVFIPMQPHNIMKVLEGEKTSTIRAKEMTTLDIGETGSVFFRENKFLITNLGYLTIEESGGKENIIKTEGLKDESEFMFKQSRDWVNGKGRMWVYKIIKDEE